MPSIISISSAMVHSSSTAITHSSTTFFYSLENEVANLEVAVGGDGGGLHDFGGSGIRGHGRWQLGNLREDPWVAAGGKFAHTF